MNIRKFILDEGNGPFLKFGLDRQQKVMNEVLTLQSSNESNQHVE